MSLESKGLTGLAIGAWGAVQTTATGVAVFLGGAIRDGVAAWMGDGDQPLSLADAVAPYSMVYHIEILILFAALVALGPLVRRPGEQHVKQNGLQLADFPG
jgi:BCD family chlorophyll transporter-like MFS transporter